MSKQYSIPPAARVAARGLLFCLVAAAAVCRGQELKGPEQPIPYSHKTHLALGVKCSDCHSNPDPGDAMTYPPTSKCMSCHQSIKKDSPAIQKLAAFDRDKKDVPWVRVYKLPDFVYFSHKSHLDANAKCEDCHGQVAQRDRLFREGDLSMAGCVSCHRDHNASQDCNYCHEER